MLRDLLCDFWQDKREPLVLREGAEEGGKEGRRRRRPPCWNPMQCPTPLMRRRSARSKRLNTAAQKWSSWKLVAPEAPMWMNSVEENGEVEKWKWKGKKKGRRIICRNRQKMWGGHRIPVSVVRPCFMATFARVNLSKGKKRSTKLREEWWGPRGPSLHSPCQPGTNGCFGN